MDALARMLRQARFYGAKSEAIDAVDILREAPAAEGRLLLLRVHHGGHSDLYQVLVDAAAEDILGRGGVATAYGNALADGTPVTDGMEFVVAVNNYRRSGGGNFPHVSTAPVVYKGARPRGIRIWPACNPKCDESHGVFDNTL